jgi:hypothetical protein
MMGANGASSLFARRDSNRVVDRLPPRACENGICAKTRLSDGTPLASAKHPDSAQPNLQTRGMQSDWRRNQSDVVGSLLAAVAFRLVAPLCLRERKTSVTHPVRSESTESGNTIIKMYAG